MEEGTEAVPLASAAAWSPQAAPAPKFESRVLKLDPDLLKPAQEAEPGGDEAVEPPRPQVDRLAALRDIARRLRSAPDSEETLQFVIDSACECTGSDAGMLTLQAPHSRQFVSGTALGAGPYISVALRVGGPSFGEIVLTRLSGADEYHPEDETFGELVAEYIAKAVSALRRGTVLSQEEQDFIDRITQEMRSPLASTVNALAVVLGGAAGDLADEARTYLASASGDARRLLGSLDSLMTLAHLRPPELRDMETVPVGPWLAGCVERFRPRAEERGIELVYTPAASALLMECVPGQLELAAGELLGNALKFTESGGRVDVTAGTHEGMLKISVSDTGIGFDDGEANRMTECFARAITAEAARIPGLGIGLFLANEIVKNHGGRLWLESRRDEGTQAHLSLLRREQ